MTQSFSVRSHPDGQWQSWGIGNYKKAAAMAKEQSRAYPGVVFLVVDHTGWVWSAYRNGKAIPGFLPYQLIN
jgi:hypothetical protein